MEKINKVVFIDDEATTDYHKYIVEKMQFAEEALFFTQEEEALKYLQSIENNMIFLI